MEPPKHILDAIEAVHPMVRIGWEGRERKTDDELNAGQFHLIQLYHQRDASRCFHDPWRNRGPLYGSRYDPLKYVPFRIETLEHKDVFGGRVVEMVKGMMGDFYSELVAARSEQGRDWDRYIHDLATEAADRMFFENNKTDATRGLPTPYKCTTEEDKAVLSGEKLTKVEDSLVPLPGSY